jgi:hypothetical protein
MNRPLVLAGLAAFVSFVGAPVASAETVTIVAERIQRVSVSTAPQGTPAGRSRVRTIPLWSAPYSQQAVPTPGLLENDGAFASHTPGAVGSARAGGAAGARLTAAGAK